MNRSRLARVDPRFAAAKKLPSGSEQTKAFQIVNAAHVFTTFHALTLGSSFRQSYLGDHFLAQEAQLLAKRAFGALQRFNFGLGGKHGLKSPALVCGPLHAPVKQVALHPRSPAGK